jgi:transcriptional regulator with XRE-family HTH domain
MPLLIDDATRIRVIRALVGMTTAHFAKHLGCQPGAVTDWEHGRSEPRSPLRKKLWELCHERGIAFLPCGMPVPYHATLTLKESRNEKVSA